jgi:triphosphatase
MPQEIELRLSARHSDAARLIDSPAVSRLASGPSATVQLNTRYYDTPELAFARSGLSLRVRNKGRSFVQTVKTAGTGALLSERDA